MMQNKRLSGNNCNKVCALFVHLYMCRKLYFHAITDYFCKKIPFLILYSLTSDNSTRLKPWVNWAVSQVLTSLFTLNLALYRVAASHMTFLHAVLDLPSLFVCWLNFNQNL